MKPTACGRCGWDSGSVFPSYSLPPEEVHMTPANYGRSMDVLSGLFFFLSGLLALLLFDV
jgi:hypothetical protein